MVMLMEVHTSRGLIGRCDAKCYNALHGKCICVCNGRNHGVGQKKAMKNTKTNAKKWIAKYKNQKGFRWRSPFKQKFLFDDIPGSFLNDIGQNHE